MNARPADKTGTLFTQITFLSGQGHAARPGRFKGKHFGVIFFLFVKEPLLGFFNCSAAFVGNPVNYEPERRKLFPISQRIKVKTGA